MEIDLRGLGFDPSMMQAINTMFDVADEFDADKPHQPSRAYVRDTKAMRNTPADILEFPNHYQFVVDMPGLKADQISVHLEDGNLLVVSGERRRQKEKHEKEEGVKYLRMERRLGKMMKKFLLPENANKEAISAVYQDGELTVTVEKVPPPEPKKPRTIEVKAGGSQPGQGSVTEGASGGGQHVQVG